MLCGSSSPGNGISGPAAVAPACSTFARSASCITRPRATSGTQTTWRRSAATPISPEPSGISAPGRLRVPVGRDGEEPVPDVVAQQEDRLGEAEEVLQGLEGRLRGLAVVDTQRQPAGQLVQPTEDVALGLPYRRPGIADRRAPQDAVDVDAPQAEDPCHPALRGQRLEVRGHGVERRPLGFRVRAAQVQGVFGHGVRVDNADLAVGIGVEVGSGLVEELARERHALRVDVPDDRHVREGERLGHSREPAFGPGVWS
jgi:hypothetical protein